MLPKRVAIVVCLMVGVVAGLYFIKTLRAPVAEVLAPGASANRGIASFVSDRACETCHAEQFNDWLGSHHAHAMQEATASTVLGDFNNATFTAHNVTYRFFKRHGRFFVHTPGHDTKPTDFEVTHTFGVDPLQQYLVDFPGGRKQCLTVAWDTRRKRWFSLYPRQEYTADTLLHWTGRYQNWNMMCAQCHTTNFRKGYDAKSDTYASTFSEGNVGCQACHGAGSAHLEWARAHSSTYGSANSGRGSSPDASAADKGLLVDFRAHDAHYEVDQCAACHARRATLTDPARIGAPLLDNYLPETLRPNLYYADGQQQGEVYAYGSFRQSKMYAMGVRCTDCHRAHSLRLQAEGNAVCLQCHNTQGNSRFPTLTKKNYDTPLHTFHKAGASCVACHMSTSTYMQVHERPDHAIRIPRPDLSVKLGVPNACNKCHTDKTPQWAVAAMEREYGKEFERQPTSAKAVALARAGAARAGPALVAIANDTRQPGIMRATALDLLRNYDQGTAAAVKALHDDDPVVRVAAVDAAAALPAQERVAQVSPMLDDAVRAVRVEATRVMATVPRDQLDASRRDKLDAAMTEYQSAQMAMADMPSSRFNLGAMCAAMGQFDRAEQAYLDAIRLDPYFLPARFNLANLYNQKGRNKDAEKVLREGIVRAPREGELYYSLGLLLAEEKRLPESTEALAKAVRLMPRQARILYNYGLALQLTGRRVDAENALLSASQIEPADSQILYALATFYAQQKKWNRAQKYAERLLRQDPHNPQFTALLARIKQALRKTAH